MPAAGFCLFETTLGDCAIAWREDGVICGAQLPELDAASTRERMRSRFPAAIECEPPEGIAAVLDRLRAMLAGAPDSLLDVPLDEEGVPPFHRKVYAVTRAIPPGRTLTYGEVAAQLGEPGSARAVGQALGHNPFAPIVPCHRVLAAHNAGGGFSATGGVATKLRMLQVEGAQFGSQAGLF